MRYLMLAVFSAMLLAPLVGCHEDTKTTEKTNPFTGSHTTEKETNVNGN